MFAIDNINAKVNRLITIVSPLTTIFTKQLYVAFAMYCFEAVEIAFNFWNILEWGWISCKI